MQNKQKNLSKFLSLVLRHQPDLIGLSLDKEGWASVAELIEKSKTAGKGFDLEELKQMVADNDKQRFKLNEDCTKIRANQGHSIEIDINLPPTTPPEFLYHGTATRFLGDIRKTGLQKMSRQHVHLSADKITAEKVGSRHGVPHILVVKSGDMHRAGFVFFLSENGVWLTEQVPTEYFD